MKYLWALALVPVHALIGVPDELAQHYDLKGKDKFHCISDKSIVIDVSQVNDGICDCPDGSDEVLTGACNDLSTFYCHNEGFIPRYISGSKVNDGLCDCCDCSDESMSPTINWRGLTCSEVDSEYQWMVSKELENYQSGIKALQEFNKDDLKDAIPEDQRRSNDEINKEIESVGKEIDSSIERLEREQQNYMERLQLNDPLGYSFLERFDLKDITERVNETFNVVVIRVANSFQDINGILDRLSREYERSLNDKAVIRNVDAYEKFIRSKVLDPVTINGEVESELRDQLIEYFNVDVPKLFLGKATKERDAEYVINKFDFVKKLIEGKTNYSGEILHKGLKRLLEFMSMITSQYNVNFQDPGVLTAVDAYKKYLAENIDLIERDGGFEVDATLQKDLEEMHRWVSKHAHEILSGKDHLPEDIAQLKSLRNQVQAHEKELQKMETRVQRLKAELRLNTLDANDERSQFIRTLAKINDQYNGCIESSVDQFKYIICFKSTAESPETEDYTHVSGIIVQKEREGTNEVVLGQFDESHINQLRSVEAQELFEQKLESVYPDLSIYPHMRNETLLRKDGQPEEEHTYLYGNLYEMNQPLALGFDQGTKCWMGPSRSVSLTLRCAERFEVLSVTEPNLCVYQMTLAGPLGCRPGYEFHKA
ncbi:Gtb1p [Nakaseomyces bracarensis]|uniref:Gtb1p n=1 Tax=Nakaseomyces bracarensis TaxID=273131 RepID=UPI0038728361